LPRRPSNHAASSDTGLFGAVELVNRLAVRPEGESDAAALAQILSVDPPSVQHLRSSDVAGFGHLAEQLSHVFAAFAAGDDGSAADLLNMMLATHPAHPRLAMEHGRWRMHHHTTDAALVGMWTSICAEALARLLAGGNSNRAGVCADADCGRVYLDTSRNASRRFCSVTCQNRVKTAALRRRRSIGPVERC
jgi:predicted RNA-binding Zn ribbon-like protein